MKNKNGLKKEKEGKIAGMTPVEFTRFNREKTIREVNAEIKRLRRRKKLY